MIDRDNYIVIQGWMVTDLKLKGVPLMVYACIYGFSQADGQTFHGGIEYIMDWAGAAKRSVLYALNQLEKRGLIERIEAKDDKRKTEWRAVKIGAKIAPIGEDKIGAKIAQNRCKNCTEFESPPLIPPLNKFNNKNINNNIPPINTPQKETDKNASNDASPAAPRGGVSALIIQIIAYLNEKTGKRFSPKSAVAIRHIKARLKEGYTLSDFRTVIDKKVRSWKNDARMAQYLRPETLFGTKFDGYLNEVERPMTYQDAQNENFDYDGWARTHDPFGRPLDEFGNPYDEEGADESGDDRF